MFPEVLPLDVGNLVNRSHPLARGLLDWWMVLPQQRGGTRLMNLQRPHVPLTLDNMQAGLNETTGWHTTRRRGGFGELRFAGVDERLSALSRPEWFFGTGAGDLPFTVSCALWIDTLGATDVHFVSKASFNIGGEWALYYYRSDHLYFQVYDTFTSTAMWAGATYTSAAYLNQWLTLTGTYTGSADPSGLALYRNGVRVDIPGLSGESASGLYTQMRNEGVNLACGWGQDEALTGWWFTGRMDDIRLYPRALSAREVMALYQNQQAGYPGLLNRVSWDNLGYVPRGRKASKAPTRVWRKGK